MPLKELTCTNCYTRIRKKVCDSINVEDNPKYIKDILEGKFNYSACPKCKTRINHKSHVLLTYLNPPRWIWLVAKEFQNPSYPETFFNNYLPQDSTELIEQKMVFINFGEPCESLEYVLNDKMPQSVSGWLGLGKILTGEKAIDCYKNALMMNFNHKEAKNLLSEEYDKLKTYSIE
ncbi:MAG: hypothetical protein KAS63_06820 [Candidatus Heimdallarchaeota archaeon]|nr:hypothetical protein [Candidatus Heimdallarchaeota archaeon]MCK4955057.1 hypothetical protein [Candidatus Heimdallarchaeota archaeon]